MKYTILIVTATLFLLVRCNELHAQWFGGFGNMGYHASTVAEGEGNAISAVTRSKGQYQLDASQARINNAQADAIVMQNRKQLAKDYFETQALNRQARFGDYAERKKKHTQEALFQHGYEGRPTRLTSMELDPVTGEISWPIDLQSNYFKKYVQEIDGAFVSRAASKIKFSYTVYKEANKNVKGIQKELKLRMKEIGTNAYANSLQFIKRLSKEIKVAVQTG